MKPSDVLQKTGRVIGYRPKLAKLFGSVTAEILFEQILYWQDKADSELGVYKTQAELEEETGLSVDEQRTARKKLRNLEILIETEKRLEHRIYYKINLEKLDEFLTSHFASDEKKNDNSAKQEMSSPRNGESPLRRVGKTDFVNTLDYNTRLHTQDNNHLNPPTAEKENAIALRDEIANLLENKFNCVDAKELHDTVEQFLIQQGFDCVREFPVANRGDGRKGRVDLLVTKSGVSVGIELDNQEPRDKSLFKLNQLPAGLIVLRNGLSEMRDKINDILIISTNFTQSNSSTKNPNVDYQAVMDVFNQTVADTPIRQIRVLTDKRKQAIHSLAKLFKKEFGGYEPDVFKNYFTDFVEQANEREDKFYYGGGKTQWVANFDYIIRTQTAVKALENAL